MNNPKVVTDMILDKNPQIRAILNESNGNAKEAFYKLARQKGVNPDDILNQFK